MNTIGQEKPRFLYKYRKITNTQNLAQDGHIKGLFGCYGVYASRKCFKDPDDSKINFYLPSPKVLKNLYQRVSKRNKAEVKALFHKGRLTGEGENFLADMKSRFGRMVDTYPIHCLAGSGNNWFLWENYADKHQGFCIEFNADRISAEKVGYQERLPALSIKPMLSMYFDMKIDDAELGKKISTALKTKLDKFSEEDEWRIIAPNENGRVLPCDIMTMAYPPEWVTSVIFGADMPEDHKQFIRDHLPFQARFRQAVLQANDTVWLEDYR